MFLDGDNRNKFYIWDYESLWLKWNFSLRYLSYDIIFSIWWDLTIRVTIPRFTIFLCPIDLWWNLEFGFKCSCMGLEGVDLMTMSCSFHQKKLSIVVKYLQKKAVIKVSITLNFSPFCIQKFKNHCIIKLLCKYMYLEVDGSKQPIKSSLKKQSTSSTKHKNLPDFIITTQNLI